MAALLMIKHIVIEPDAKTYDETSSEITLAGENPGL